jgi:hypothetical protein
MPTINLVTEDGKKLKTEDGKYLVTEASVPSSSVPRGGIYRNKRRRRFAAKVESMYSDEYIKYLKEINPEHMTQKEFEIWREISGS